MFENFTIITPLGFQQNIYLKEDVTHIYARLSCKLDKSFLSKYPNLKFIGCPTTSIDHIDKDFCDNKRIRLITIGKQKKLLKNITSTAELATWLLIELSRNPSKYAKNVFEGNWDRYQYKNQSLNGKTLGIIGLGRVGRQVARVFSNLGMTIIFFDSRRFKLSRYRRVFSLNQIAEQSDFISIHVNGVVENKHLISREFLTHLKQSGSYIINTSRGLVVNEVDVVDSLTNGNLIGYATDVLDGENESDLKWLSKNPLWKELISGGNLIVTPHIGGATVDSLLKVDQYVLKNLAAKK